MPRTECGIFAHISRSKIKYGTVLNGLKALQHRGQESYGITYVQGKSIIAARKKGLVGPLTSIGERVSHSWLGHVRYSTSGVKGGDEEIYMACCQPITCESELLGPYSIAHNGTVPPRVWESIKKKYTSLKTDTRYSDTVALVGLINLLGNAYSEGGACDNALWKKILIELVDIIPGAFCIVIQTIDEFWILRDRYSLRPMVMSKTDDALQVSSESVGLSISGDLIDIPSGAVINVTGGRLSVKTAYRYPDAEMKRCIFEYIYFLRDKTIADGVNVTDFRLTLGKTLEAQVRATFPHLIEHWKKKNALICGVPASGILFGEGFASALDLSYNQFLKKRADYPWRTFILETRLKRAQACAKKYIVEDDVIRDKVIILVDDSIVRGNTLGYLIKYLKSFNPAEIHIISGSPPVKYGCHYGVDFPDIEELIANRIAIADMATFFDIDSFTYLDVGRLKQLEDNVCAACFTGEYMF